MKIGLTAYDVHATRVPRAGRRRRRGRVLVALARRARRAPDRLRHRAPDQGAARRAAPHRADREPRHRAGRPARAARRGRRGDRRGSSWRPASTSSRCATRSRSPARRAPCRSWPAAASSSASASAGSRRSSPSLDVPFAERVTRFEESIEVLRAAWRSGEVKHEGRHFSISGVQVTKRVTDIPLMLGRQQRAGPAACRPPRRRLVLLGHAAVRGVDPAARRAPAPAGRERAGRRPVQAGVPHGGRRPSHRPALRGRGLRGGPHLDRPGLAGGRAARGQARGDVRRRRCPGRDGAPVSERRERIASLSEPAVGTVVDIVRRRPRPRRARDHLRGPRPSASASSTSGRAARPRPSAPPASWPATGWPSSTRTGPSTSTSSSARPSSAPSASPSTGACRRARSAHIARATPGLGAVRGRRARLHGRGDRGRARGP